MSAVNQGIVWVSDAIGEDGVRACLPPEHRVVAVSQRGEIGYAEMLIEGPSLPPVVDGEAPPKVILRLRMVYDRAHDAVQHFASWAHRPAVEWPVPGIPLNGVTDEGAVAS